MSDLPQGLVGVLRSERDFEAAVQELELAGIDRSRISLLAHEGVMERCLEAVNEDALGDRGDHIAVADLSMEDDRQQTRVLFTSLAAAGGALAGAVVATVATGGAVIPALLAAGAAGGAGAGLTAFFASRAERSEHDWAEAEIAKGGILIWVYPATVQQEARARDILGRYCHGEVRQAEAA